MSNISFGKPVEAMIDLNLNEENVNLIITYYKNKFKNSESGIEIDFYLKKIVFFENLCLALHAVNDIKKFLKQ